MGRRPLTWPWPPRSWEILVLTTSEKGERGRVETISMVQLCVGGLGKFTTLATAVVRGRYWVSGREIWCQHMKYGHIGDNRYAATSSFVPAAVYAHCSNRETACPVSQLSRHVQLMSHKQLQLQRPEQERVLQRMPLSLSRDTVVNSQHAPFWHTKASPSSHNQVPKLRH